jgi:hypothetical protein
MLTGWVAVFVSFSSGIILAYHGCWYGLLMVLGLLLLYYWRFKWLSLAMKSSLARSSSFSLLASWS